MRAHRWRSIAIFLLGMVVVNGLVIWYGRGFISNGYGDFAAFYTAGKLLRTGDGANLYARADTWRIQEEFASHVTIRKGPLPYIRPPFEALIFEPFSYFSYPVACVIWMVITILLLIAIPAILLSRSRDDMGVPPLLLGVLCLAFAPAAITLLHGQDAVLLLLLLALAFRLMKQKAAFRAGIFVGLGFIKFHLIIPLLVVFAFKKQWRTIAGAFTIGLLLIFISAGITGWKGVVRYPGYLWQLNRSEAAGVVSVTSMPNIRGALAVIFPKMGLSGANILLFAILAISVLVAAYVWRGTNQNNAGSLDAGFSFAIVAVLLGSVYTYSYDMTLLLLPLLSLTTRFLGDPGLAGWPKKMFFGSAAVLCFTPLYWMIFFGVGRFCWFIVPMLGLAISLAFAAWYSGSISLDARENNSSALAGGMQP